VRGYGRDLAFIHNAGYSGYALGAAPGLLRILRTHKITRGLVVDLGCGSGRWARELNRAGYDELGVDQSRAMIALARRIAPKSRFKVASLLRTALPRCDAITSIGECVNYCFDRATINRSLMRLFKRAYGALRPGGILACDFATPKRRPEGGAREHRSARPGWRIVARTTAHAGRGIRREIVAFRKVGGAWRRSAETHDLRLYSAAEISDKLQRCGFRVRVVRGYGRFRFPRGIEGVVAVKPGFRERRR
jgi:SAM-dependent methyltransferase